LEKSQGLIIGNIEKINDNETDIGAQNKLIRKPFLNWITFIISLLLLLYYIVKLIPTLWFKLMKVVVLEFHKKKISEFRKHKEYKDDEFHKFVYEMYNNHGESFLQMSKNLLTENNNELLRDLIFINELEKDKIKKFENNLITNMNVAKGNRLKDYIQTFPRNNDLLNVLINHEFIKIEELEDEEMPFQVLVNNKLVEALNEFLHFLNYKR